MRADQHRRQLLRRAVTQAQKDQIEQQLNSLKPLVKNVYYESQAQAFDRFKQQFKGSAILKGVTADQMPESYRVKLSDPKKYDVIASSFQGAPGWSWCRTSGRC